MTSQGQPSSYQLPRWTILSVTTLGAFMAALDSNIVTIALPAISRGLTSGISLLGWVITGYALASAVLVIQAGKLGDKYGKKKVYLTGFAVFGIASALCGMSLDAYQLVVFRVVQGLGASLLVATALPLVFASFPPSERGQAVGINSVAWALGAVTGPIIGGVLTQIDWRLIFFVNVPVASAAVLVGLKRIPQALDRRNDQAGRLNLVNATLLGLTVAVWILWLTFFDARLVPVGAVTLAAFALAERSSKEPMLNRELIHNRGFVFSAVGLAVMQVAFLGIPFVMSFYFQSVAGFSPLMAGLWLAPLPVAIGIFNPIGGRVFDRLRRPALISMMGALVVAGCVVGLSLALASPTPGLYVAALLAVAGVGGGFVWAPSISSGLKFSRPELRGVANGTTFTLINVAFAASVAIVISVSAGALPPALVGEIYQGSVSGLTAAQAALFGQGLARALLALVVVGVVGIPILFLVAREQAKSFRQYVEVPVQDERGKVGSRNG
ncbi:MAG: MFS transporter [Nitrososphaerales archaeon]|nr:MFS transporter [Nitrososphaerales archaeon]